MFRISMFLLIGMLLVSCASSAPETAAVTVQPLETKSPTVPPTPVSTPSVEPQAVAELTGTIWYMETYHDSQGNLVPFLSGSVITAKFGQDGTLSGSSGCNTYSGSYQLDGDQLQIGPLASTMMACLEPAGLMDQETAYLQVLSTAASFRLADGKLELLDDAGQVILVYSDTPPATVQLPAATDDVARLDLARRACECGLPDRYIRQRRRPANRWGIC